MGITIGYCCRGSLLRGAVAGILRRLLSGAACGLIALTFVATASAETLVIPGSGNPEYVLRELAKAYNSQQTRHQVVVPPSIGTSGGVREVSEGIATIGRVGRPLNARELALGLTYHPRLF